MVNVISNIDFDHVIELFYLNQWSTEGKRFLTLASPLVAEGLCSQMQKVYPKVETYEI